MIRQAFSCFDKDGKGFVSATDISRVLAESGEGTLSEEVCIEVLHVVLAGALVGCALPRERKYVWTPFLKAVYAWECDGRVGACVSRGKSGRCCLFVCVLD